MLISETFSKSFSHLKAYNVKQKCLWLLESKILSIKEIKI